MSNSSFCGLWVVAMGGCYGWLLWVVAMGGCYGWYIASTPLSTPCGFEPSRVRIPGATSIIFYSDPRGGPPNINERRGPLSSKFSKPHHRGEPTRFTLLVPQCGLGTRGPCVHVTLSRTSQTPSQNVTKTTKTNQNISNRCCFVDPLPSSLAATGLMTTPTGWWQRWGCRAPT